MGCGFLESVSQECLSLELSFQEIPFPEQNELPLTYWNRPFKQKYKSDFICFDKIILKIKAVLERTDEHRALVHNYQKAAGFRLGFPVSFGHYPKVQWERIAR